MSWLKQRRTWFRLIGAVFISGVVTSLMLNWHLNGGSLTSVNRTWYVDPWINEQNRELMRYSSLASDKFSIETQIRWAITGPFETTDEPVPLWAREKILAIKSYYERGSIGWPMSFADYEGEVNEDGNFVVNGIRTIGIVPIATQLKFPGFLLLICMVYVGLLITERLVRIPRLLRYRRRLRQGLCGKCGYELEGIQGEVCPECGQTIESTTL